MQKVRLVIDPDGLLCWVPDNYDGAEQTLLGPFWAVRFAYKVVRAEGPNQLLVKDGRSYKHVPAIRIFDQVDRDAAQRMAEGLAWQVNNARFSSPPCYGISVPLCVGGDVGEAEIEALLVSPAFLPALAQLEMRSQLGIRAVVVDIAEEGAYGGTAHMDGGQMLTFVVNA